MRPVLLIAGNYVREQRWVVAAWVAMAFGFAGIIAGFDAEPATEDVEFYFSQQALFGIGLGAFLAVSAIHNERRSRRIVAVLSKSVRRGQYVAGLLLGVFLCCGAHGMSVALARSWLAARLDLPVEPVWTSTGVVLVAGWLAASVAMFCSTFTGPLGAAIGSGALMGAPLVAARYLSEDWMQSLPVYWLATSAVAPASHGPAEVPWAVLALAVAEVVAFCGAASWVFSRRDVTAALE